MATGQVPIRIQTQLPRRRPVRASRPGPPVARTAGSTGHRLDRRLPAGGAGLTVSSILVAEGQATRQDGLIGSTSGFREAMQEAGAWSTSLLSMTGSWPAVQRGPPRSGRRLMGSKRPTRPGSRCWGAGPRAASRLAGSVPVGHAELVAGVIEQLELPDLEDRLAYLQGATSRWVISPATGEVHGVRPAREPAC